MLIVQKYGGSSVADAERVFNVARRIMKTKAEGNQVVVVLSAQGKTIREQAAERWICFWLRANSSLLR